MRGSAHKREIAKIPGSPAAAAVATGVCARMRNTRALSIWREREAHEAIFGK